MKYLNLSCLLAALTLAVTFAPSLVTFFRSTSMVDTEHWRPSPLFGGAVLLVAAIGAADILIQPTPNERQSAIDAIRRSGGCVTMQHANAGRLGEVFGGSENEAGPIEAIEILDAQVADAALWKTGILFHPEALRVLRAPLDEDDLARLKCFRKLHTLDLYHGKIASNAALVHLQELRSLECLVIRGSKIDDCGLRHVLELSCLQRLVLNGTGITDAGLSEIGKLWTLSELSVCGTRITDAGLRHIAELENLTQLDVSNTAVTDVGMALLHRLANLQRLTIERTDVSPAAVRLLVQKIPGCCVVRARDLDESLPSDTDIQDESRARTLAQRFPSNDEGV